MPIDITNAGDLKVAYLQTFDSFSLQPSDIVESSEGRVNLRYARELLGTLVQARLLAVTEVEGEDHWQVVNPGTYDNHTREEAEAVIDAWLSGTKSADSTPTTSTRRSSSMPKNESGKCRCGCGGDTKSNYRPGHDARHAGEVGRAIAANYATPGFDRRELLAALPTDALKSKAEGIAEKAIEKAEKRSKPADEPQIEQGIIKVGKKEFAATRTSDGQVTYYEGDKVKHASKTAAKTFTVG